MNAARLLATALAQAQAGTVFAGHRLLDELGRGAMGVVFSACHLSSKRVVALKMPRADADPSLVQRFRSEAEAAAALDHPGILPIHEVGESEGVPFFTMRFAECGSLAERVNSFQNNPRAAAELIAQVADALAHAHERGLLHRDVKPSNILLAAPDEPLLGDFGLARWLGRDSALTLAGSVLGTPSYLAPELLGERPEATTTSDLFSLGAVLYHLLCGRPPFTGESVAATLAQVAEATPPAPRSLNAALPRDLEAIVLRSIEREPARRYGSVRAFAADLRRFLAGEPVVARAASPVEVAWRWCRRRPALATLIALLASVTVASFVVINTARSRLADALDRAELDRAEDLFRAGDSTNGLALLARVVRRNPSHPVAGPRLASALWHGNFALPMPPPFFAGGYVRGMSLLRDGRTLLVATSAGIATWDAATGRRLLDFENNGDRFSAAVLSPDERTLAAWDMSLGKNLSIFDVATGRRCAPPIPHENWLWTAAFSSDSSHFVTAGPDDARIYDVRSGEALGGPMLHPPGLWNAVFSPDGETVATCAGKTIRLWESHSQALRHEFPPFANELRLLRFSPDGRWLLAACVDGVMRFFSTADGQPAGLLMRHEDEVRAATFSADGKRLLTASNDHTARLWSVPGGEPAAPPLRHRDTVSFADFSADGARIVTCSSDHTTRVWDARTARPLTQPLHHFEQPRSAVFMPDGFKLIAGGADGIVQSWDLPMGFHGVPQDFSGRLAGFSADGRLVIAAASTRQPFVWDASTARPLPVLTPFSGATRLARIAPDGGCAAVVSESGDLTILSLSDAATRPPMAIPEAKGITDVCFNAEGTRIATASQNQTARVWNGLTGEAITPPLAHGEPVASVRFSPDGRTLLTATVSPANYPTGLDAARLWDIATGQLFGKPMQHIDDVCVAEFSSDGKLVATASEDNTACIWDARTGEAISPVLRHGRTVATVAFSPDNRRVVTSSWDGTARVWDARTGAPLARPLRHDDHVLDARFSPDGRRIVTASRDKTVRLWDAATGQPLTEPLRHDAAVLQVRFHPDGQRVIASTAEAARIWEVPDFSTPQPEWLVELAEAISRSDLPSSQAAAQDAIAQYERTRARAMAVSGTDAYSQLARRLFSLSSARAGEP